MELMGSLKRQIRNVAVFKAYTWGTFLKQIFLFPYDYYIRDGTSSHPMNIALFLTLRCNARCEMCNLIQLLDKDKDSEPTLENIQKFIKSVAHSNPSIILFGGEPFVRSDIFDVLSVVKNHGLNCGIFTNGLLLNEDKIKELIRLELDYIAFSLLGIGEGHNKIVGIKNAYEKLINNIRMFCEMDRKTRVIIHTTITEDNLQHLMDIVELGKTLKVDQVRFGHPTFFTDSDVEKSNAFCKINFPNEDIKEFSYSYNPTGKEEKFYSVIKGLKEKYNGSICFSPELGDSEIKTWYSNKFITKRKCFFAWRGCFVYPNGDVVPCESISYKMGNIYRQSFEDIWNGEKYKDFRRKLKNGLFPACVRCCKL